MNPLNPDIIRKSKAGDMLAFRELVIRSTPYAYQVAFRILNDEDEARDAVQESMIKVWKKLDGFHEGNNFKTWLYRIVVHTCFDILRKQKRNPEFRPDEKLWEKLGSSMADGTNIHLEKRETALIIRSLSRKLSPLQKAVFVMSELMQLEQEEIAEILNTNKSAVKANLYNARKGIKIMMEKKL
jgi:RNA polymerase sigma-70 factor (ECF subfamily)